MERQAKKLYFVFSPMMLDKEGLNIRSLRVSRKAYGAEYMTANKTKNIPWDVLYVKNNNNKSIVPLLIYSMISIKLLI